MGKMMWCGAGGEFFSQFEQMDEPTSSMVEVWQVLYICWHVPLGFVWVFLPEAKINGGKLKKLEDLIT